MNQDNFNNFSSKVQIKRKALSENMANHLLTHGLSGFTLRAVAQACQTSDRMLLHYFSDKNEVLYHALTTVSQRLINHLNELSLSNVPPRQLLQLLQSVTQSSDFLPYQQLWLELAAQSSREAGLCREAAMAIADGFLHWIEQALAGSVGNPQSCAAAIMAVLEGQVVLNAVGKQSSALQVLDGLEQF